MSNVDFAIVGSDQASALLAAVLAQDHHKKVLLVQYLAAPYRLPRDFYLSFPMATRPETFDFVNSQHNEAQHLLTQTAGRRVLLNVSPLCRAHSFEGTEALAHMMHLARYYGLEMDRVEGDAGQAHSAFRIRGVQWVRPRLLWPALAKRVIDAGVQVADASEVRIVTRRDGSARIVSGATEIEADQVALTDGSALEKFGHKGDVRQTFTRQWGTALLTEPTEMRDSVVLQPEQGFCAWRQANGTLGSVARVCADHVSDLVRANIDAKSALRRAGMSEFTQMLPTDGAPVIGRFSRSNVMVVNGFGQSTLYLVSAIARYLAGRATEAENRYFEARGPNATRQIVADFAVKPEPGDVES